MFILVPTFLVFPALGFVVWFFRHKINRARKLCCSKAMGRRKDDDAKVRRIICPNDNDTTLKTSRYKSIACKRTCRSNTSSGMPAYDMMDAINAQGYNNISKQKTNASKFY